MELYLRHDTLARLNWPALTEKTGREEVVRGDIKPVAIRFVNVDARSVVDPYASTSPSILFQVREEAGGTVLVESSTFTKTGSSKTATFTIEPSFNTNELDAVLGVGTTELPEIDLLAQVEITLSGDVSSTLNFPIRVQNDIARSGGASPVDADTLATQAEAEAGVNNAKWMSPLRTKQAIDANAPSLGDTVTPTSDSGEPAFSVPDIADEWLMTRPKVNSRKRMLIIGSSVASGTGASDYAHSWAGLLTAALPSWTVTNVSYPGNPTIAVLTRLHTDVLAYQPDVVVVGMSLYNDGLVSASSGAGKEAVYSGFRENILRIAACCRQHGARPFFTTAYPSNAYSLEDYGYLKRWKNEFESLGLEGFDFMSSLDNGSGQWNTGTYSDALHPNDTGHAEMFNAINVDVFSMPENRRRLVVKKPTACYWQGGGTGTFGVDIELSHEARSLTLSFWAKFESTTNVRTAFASIWRAAQDAYRLRTQVDLVAGFYPLTEVGAPSFISDGAWHNYVISIRNNNGSGAFYCDGALIEEGAITSPYIATHLMVGGRNDSTAFYTPVGYIRDVVVLRSYCDLATAKRLFAGDVPSLSLDAYLPLTDGNITSGARAKNYAPSLTTATYLHTNQALKKDNYVPQYVDEEDAAGYGLPTGEIFKLSTGDLRVKL